MFLSEAQLNLIETVAESGPIDILGVNILTLSALIVRGAMSTNVARKKHEVTTVVLTEVGEAIAEHLDLYRMPPKYREVLDKSRKVKYG